MGTLTEKARKIPRKTRSSRSEPMERGEDSRVGRSEQPEELLSRRMDRRKRREPARVYRKRELAARSLRSREPQRPMRRKTGMRTASKAR